MAIKEKYIKALRNPLRSFHKITHIISDNLQVVLFHIIKKPIYKASYNSNCNKFQCEGTLTRCRLRMEGVNNTLIVERGASINNVRFDFAGTNCTIIIHKDVKWLEGGRIILYGHGNLLEIGENSLLCEVLFVLTDENNRICIGKNSMFSTNVVLRTSDQHQIFNEKGERINPGKDILIGEHVWIGYGATILKGSSLENNSIVGTESVVTGLHLPQNSVAAGNPARIIKHGVNWKR